MFADARPEASASGLVSDSIHQRTRPLRRSRPKSKGDRIPGSAAHTHRRRRQRTRFHIMVHVLEYSVLSRSMCMSLAVLPDPTCHRNRLVNRVAPFPHSRTSPRNASICTGSRRPRSPRRSARPAMCTGRQRSATAGSPTRSRTPSPSRRCGFVDGDEIVATHPKPSPRRARGRPPPALDPWHAVDPRGAPQTRPAQRGE